MRKQILSVMLAGAMVMASLTGCGSSASGSGLPKNIELQVPAKAGGGTDVVARAIATQVGKDSGSNLTVQNNTDGSGVVAMGEGTQRETGCKLLAVLPHYDADQNGNRCLRPQCSG